MSIKKDILWRIYLAFILLSLAGLAIIFQSARIQISEGDYWRGLADSLTTAYHSIDAERGNIYSEDKRLLATSLPYFEVRIDPNIPTLSEKDFYDNVDSLAWHLSSYFKDKSKAEYKKYLINARKSGNRYLLIRRKVTYPELLEIKSWPILRRGRYKGGLIALQQNKREVPFRILAHRTIGYVREGIQPVGLEGEFNNYLAGVKGKRLMQKIAGGTWVPINDENEIEPKNGKDIFTTLDINLQDVAESALMRTLEKHDANHGCVVLMEVKTGKIKAIANLGRIQKDYYWETYNYAVGEGTEPGSTFKLPAIMALLEDGLINLTDSVDIQKGEMKFYEEVMKDAEKHDYGKITIQKAFEISSNVGISKLVHENYGKEPEKFVDQLYKMGLGNKTGIEITGEAPPFIKTPDHSNWSGTTLPWMSVGYEVELTPLQILTFYNAVANNGKMVSPYLVTKVQEFGRPIKSYKAKVLNNKIASQETINKVKNLLEGVVEKGTAVNIRSDEYKIAGKTGTAKIADRKHGYKEVYQASFVGYFPAKDPLYSCIVVINAPSRGVYYGSYVAGPVFKEISDKIYANSIKMHEAINEKEKFYTRKNIPYAKAGYHNDLELIYNSLGVSFTPRDTLTWVECHAKDNAVALNERKVINGLVPDVVGMGLRDALYLLENNGLKVKVKGNGKVRKQSVMPGIEVRDGQQIIIELS